jgi:hypothetical protein
LPIKIAVELMTDKCRHDGLRGMSFTRRTPPRKQRCLREETRARGRETRGRGNVLITIGTIIDKRHLELDERGRVIRKVRYASARPILLSEHFRRLRPRIRALRVDHFGKLRDPRRTRTWRVRDKNYRDIPAEKLRR